ncbi:MAG: PAS domain S-box protein [Deltaproteobacteria bacterium]|nr:PAS domain S-box protein [Deltaproteobacteria bacterium]
MAGTNDCVSNHSDWRVRVFDSLSLPTLILGKDKVIVYANEVAVKKFGMPVGELMGKSCHQVFYNSKDPCSPNICPLPKVLEEKKGHSTLRRILSEENGEIWEDRVFSPILDDNGEVMYVMESVRDVTRLKVLEKALRETKEFLERAVESSACAIVAASRNGKILFMNPAAEKLFGYSVAEMVDKESVENLYPPGVARAIMKKLRDETLGGKGKLPSTTIKILNANSEEIPAEITASIMYEDGQEIATMGIFNDLREKIAVEQKLKQAQEQLAQSEKLASLGQLAAGVAHEINNPLGGILLYANSILEQMTDDNPFREDLEYVIEDANRCKEIVKSLLAYSRQTSPIREFIQFNDLLEQSLMLIRDQAIFRNIQVIRELSDDMMLVHVDKNHLTQVCINLIMNAIGAMNGEGTLLFRSYRDKPAKKAYLEIEDTGCGIPEENLSKIFDPFFTTKEPGKGTGLGLSTAYGIVQENGGNISVKQTSPHGTTFLLELPLFVPADNSSSIPLEPADSPVKDV